MEKIFAWISVVCFGALAVFIIPYEGRILCLQIMAFSLALRLTMGLFKNIRALGIRFSVITYLFRKNSSLNLEVLNLKSDLKDLDSQLKDMVHSWKPVKNTPTASLNSLGSKGPALSGLDFYERSGRAFNNEVINESFYSENAL